MCIQIEFSCQFLNTGKFLAPLDKIKQNKTGAGPSSGMVAIISSRGAASLSGACSVSPEILPQFVHCANTLRLTHFTRQLVGRVVISVLAISSTLMPLAPAHAPAISKTSPQLGRLPCRCHTFCNHLLIVIKMPFIEYL